MDLIDRYLVAVRRHLPRAQQDDIIQELSDSLRSEAEEREREAGRPIAAEEAAALLKKHGHPWLMATRYAPQQHLVGPALFPYYRQALILVLFWVVLPLTAFAAISIGISSGSWGRSWGHVISAAWNGAIYSIGIVTSVFYVLERERVRITALDNWDPLLMPEFHNGRAVPRSETVAGLVFTLTFLIWWTGLVRVPELVWYRNAPVRFIAGPIWTTLYMPVLVLVLAGLAVSVIDFVRPWRTITTSLLDMAIHAASVVVLIYVLRVRPQFVDVLGDATNADQLAGIARVINGGLTWLLVVLAAVIVLDMLYELWRVMHSRGKSVPSC